MAFHSSQRPGYFLHLVDNALTTDRISKNDADLITRFIHDQQATKAIKEIRCSKLAQTLTSWRQFMTLGFSEITRDDLFSSISKLNQSRYKRNTRNDHIVILKQFFSWLIRRQLTKIKKEELDEISAPGVDSESTEAKDLLTRDEVIQIVKACKNLRDRAIVVTLYESAARISELARVRWGDLEYTENGIINLTIHDEKTQKKRYAPLLLSIEYLAAWRSGYPGIPSNDAIAFPDSISGEMLEYRAILQQITRAAARAKIGKRCNPHVFRKSRLTEMVREGYQESVIKEIGWANPSSQMLKTYIKLGKDDVLNEFMTRSGIKKREEKAKDNAPRQCSYCFAMNSPISDFCHKCGAPLTDEVRQSLESKTNAIEQSPRYQPDIEKLVERMVEEKLKKLQVAGN